MEDLQARDERLDQRITDWLNDIPFFNVNNLISVTHEFLALRDNYHTRKAYFFALKRFFPAALPPDIDHPALITPQLIKAHLDQLYKFCATAEQLDAKRQTVKLTLMALRSYFQTLVEKRILEESPAAAVKLSTFNEPIGKTEALKREDIRRFLAAARDGSPEAARNEALIAFLLFTAARIGAALSLTFDRIIDDGANFLLTEKGHKKHIVPATANLMKHLTPYLDQLPLKRPHDPVFQVHDGAAFVPDPLPYKAAYLMIRRIAADLALKEHITPHSLRATAITAFIAAGMPLHEVQKQANHASIDTTLRYDRNPQDLERRARSIDAALAD